MHSINAKREDSIRIAGSSLTWKIKKSALWIVRRLGLSRYFRRVADAFSEEKPYFYDIYRKPRVVEYSWVLRNLQLEHGRILDVGCWGTLFPIMLASLGYEVTGADLKDYYFTHPNFRFIKGDLLDESTRKNLGERKFDAITLISTLEHVGIEFCTEDNIELDADVRLLSMLKNHISSEGIILITFPYGRPKIIKRHVDSSIAPPSYPYKIALWEKHYNEEEIRRLAEKAKLVIESKAYFAEKNGYWVPVDNAEIENLDYPELATMSAKSIVCLKLKKSN